MNTVSSLPLIPESWQSSLAMQLELDYMQDLEAFLTAEINNGKVILPEKENWFNALNSTSPDEVKVVILGQDPYPTPGHAHGLCFSVKTDVKPIPKSLINIFKELETDTGLTNPHGNLQNWARQGVLLLNSVLTVESGQANSHQGKGWEKFTDKIISTLNNSEHAIAFVLWGAYAQKKGSIIDEHKHLVIRSPHPSPLSAYRGFFGSRPFSQINAFLSKHGHAEINWSVNET
ncbi:MAG: uracil-DNA glycosylase [Gammaproteobacteria bacterium]|nr:uracil-DNA glycosylase [Gammaproteobacteria bacterium]